MGAAVEGEGQQARRLCGVERVLQVNAGKSSSNKPLFGEWRAFVAPEVAG